MREEPGAATSGSVCPFLDVILARPEVRRPDRLKNDSSEFMPDRFIVGEALLSLLISLKALWREDYWAARVRARLGGTGTYFDGGSAEAAARDKT